MYVVYNEATGQFLVGGNHRSSEYPDAFKHSTRKAAEIDASIMRNRDKDNAGEYWRVLNESEII